MPKAAVNLYSILGGRALALILGGTLLFAGCTPAPRLLLPEPTAAAPVPALVAEVNDATLADLILAERDASIAGNLPLLAELWAEDARIVDGRGTTSTADDYIWQGRAAILDRYGLAVFPAPPPPADAPALRAAPVVIRPGTGNDRWAELTHAGDRWQLVERAGRWWLYELVYSTPE